MRRRNRAILGVAAARRERAYQVACFPLRYVRRDGADAAGTRGINAAYACLASMCSTRFAQ